MIPRREWFGCAILLAAYFATRLYSLGTAPAFIDEAIHIDWAGATLRGDLMAGSWDGKWLAIKIMAAFMLLPFHVLVAARLSAVVVGAAGLLACVAIGRRLYGVDHGLLCGFFYLIFPYVLVNNRMALTDTAAMAFAGAVLYFSIEVAAPEYRDAPRRGDAPAASAAPARWEVVALAAAVICMVLAKFSTVLLMPLPVAAVLLLQPRPAWRRHLAPVAAALAVAAVPVALLIWRGHGIHFLNEKTVLGSLGSQLDIPVRNLFKASRWYWFLLTPPMAIVSVFSLLWIARRERQGADLLLLVAFLLAVVPLVVTARFWAPRYLLPSLIPLCVLVSRFVLDVWDWLGRSDGARASSKATVALTILALSLWPVWIDAQVLLTPDAAALTDNDRIAFRERWSSGQGVAEMADFLRQRSLSTAGGINVVRFYFWNQANQGLNLYLSPSASLAIHTIDPTDPEAPARIARLAAERPSFFAMNPPNESEHLAEIGRSLDDYLGGAVRVWQSLRPGGGSAVEVWELRTTNGPTLAQPRAGEAP